MSIEELASARSRGIILVAGAATTRRIENHLNGNSEARHLARLRACLDASLSPVAPVNHHLPIAPMQ